MENEIWRDIPGFDYQISNLGNVRSFKFNLSGTILKPSCYGRYKLVSLFKDGKRYYKKIHRLVAEAFIPNPDNLPQVNHKDENTFNNNVSNLEWCDAKYNANYGSRIAKMSNSLRGKSVPLKYKQVKQTDNSGNIVEIYPSIKDVSKNGYNPGTVCNCCKGKQKTAYGFKWYYV